METKLVLMLGQMAMQIAQLQADLEKAQAALAAANKENARLQPKAAKK